MKAKGEVCKELVDNIDEVEGKPPIDYSKINKSKYLTKIWWDGYISALKWVLGGSRIK